MKIYSIVTAMTALVAMNIGAQENNLVQNGSFETIDGKVCGHGDFSRADSVSSSNNTTVDLYSTEARGKQFDVPNNYMGSQGSKTGNNYAGIIAYYGDERISLVKSIQNLEITTEAGYQQYSEYIQLWLREPMVAGRAYTVNFNISLAERSAFAVSGMGVYFTQEKMDVKNNAFLDVRPHIVATNIITDKEWSTFTGTYVASGGERYLTLGCFDDYMAIQKVIPENTNNSRKAYYYIDDVSVTPAVIAEDDIVMILMGGCYRLKDLNFEFDKAVILPESYNELNALADFLKTYPSIVVFIDGHTDKVGTEPYNDQLSKERTESVKTYLVNRGVSEDRMKPRAFGETQPIINTEEPSLVNRRVEVTICGEQLIGEK